MAKGTVEGVVEEEIGLGVVVQRLVQVEIELGAQPKERLVRGRVVPAGQILVRGFLQDSTGDRRVDSILEGSKTEKEAQESLEGYWNLYAMNM